MNLHQLSADTECSLEDLLGAVNDRDGWRDIVVWEICAISVNWWWWFQIFPSYKDNPNTVIGFQLTLPFNNNDNISFVQSYMVSSVPNSREFQTDLFDPDGWLVVLFYSISTLFASFDAEFSNFDKFHTIQFTINIIFCLHTVKCQNSSISNSLVLHKYTFSKSKTVLFQTILYSTSTQFKYQNSPI